MPLTADVLKTIRDQLYTNWSLDGSSGKPSQAQITATGFVVVPRKTRMKDRAVTISLDRSSNMVRGTGSNPPIFSDDYVAIGVWTVNADTNLSLTERDNMVKEVQRIIKSLKASPPGGIMDLNLSGRRPRNDLSERDPVTAEDVIIRVMYEN